MLDWVSPEVLLRCSLGLLVAGVEGECGGGRGGTGDVEATGKLSVFVVDVDALWQICGCGAPRPTGKEGGMGHSGVKEPGGG